MNPYSFIADVVRKGYVLIGRHTSFQSPNPPIPELKDLHAQSGIEWNRAVERARQASVERGIPFATFDDALSAADGAFLKLLHMSAGDVENPALLVPAFIKLEKRLRELAATYGDNEPPSAESTATLKSRKATVNARMIDLLGKKPEAAGWTAKQFAAELQCSASMVVGTNVWKSMKLDREKGKAERASRKAAEKRRK